jgi:hypothetical protein
MDLKAHYYSEIKLFFSKAFNFCCSVIVFKKLLIEYDKQDQKGKAAFNE